MALFKKEPTPNKVKKLQITVDKSLLNDENLLGEGSFSKVYKYKIASEKEVALKKFKMKVLSSSLQNMVNRMLKPKHENVAQVVGWSADPPSIALELCLICFDDDVFTTLKYLIQYFNDNKYYNYKERLSYMSQVAKGLEYLHSHDIVHQDIKPQNFLVSGSLENIYVKVSDFGEMSVMKNSTCTSTKTADGFAGLTISYTAPEICLFNIKKPNFKSDIYSFGISVFEVMSSLNNPWEDNIATINDNLILSLIKQFEKPNMTCFNIMYGLGERELLKYIIDFICKDDPNERPMLDEIIKVLDEVCLLPSHILTESKRHVFNEENNFNKQVSKKRLSQHQLAVTYIKSGIDPTHIEKAFIGDSKGFGVIAKKNFEPGDFLVEYKGTMVLKKEMKGLEKLHDKLNSGSYVYDFRFNEKNYCIDATFYKDTLGRYVNDSIMNPNAKIEKVLINGEPFLCLFAIKTISALEEILYFYGVEDLPWHNFEREFHAKQREAKSHENMLEDLQLHSSKFDVSLNKYLPEESDELFVENIKKNDSKNLDVRGCDRIVHGMCPQKNDNLPDASNNSENVPSNKEFVGDLFKDLSMSKVSDHVKMCMVSINDPSHEETDNVLLIDAAIKHGSPSIKECNDETSDSCHTTNCHDKKRHKECFVKINDCFSQENYKHLLVNATKKDENSLSIKQSSFVVNDACFGEKNAVLCASNKRHENLSNKEQDIDMTICSPLDSKLSDSLEKSILSDVGEIPEQRDIANDSGFQVDDEVLVFDTTNENNNTISEGEFAVSHNDSSREEDDKLSLVNLEKNNSKHLDVKGFDISLDNSSPEEKNELSVVNAGKNEKNDSKNLDIKGCDGIVYGICPQNNDNLSDASNSEKVSSNIEFVGDPYKDLPMSKVSDRVEMKEKYSKPKRKCPFCGKLIQEKLTRHFLGPHKKHPRVVAIIDLDDEAQRKKEFKKLKREGIEQYNDLELLKEVPQLQSERKARKYHEKMKCSVCRAFISKRFFSSHKRTCVKENDVVPVAISLVEAKTSKMFKINDEFRHKIVDKLRQDEIGSICRNDENILYLGWKYFNKISFKKEKKTGCNKAVRSDMRNLGRLYQTFLSLEAVEKKHDNLLDMFERENYCSFCEALDLLTVNDDKTLKAGLRRNMYFLLIKSIKKLRDRYFQLNEENLSDQLEKFLKCLKSDEDIILASAQYELEVRSAKKLRKPCNLPLVSDINKIHEYTIKRIQELCCPLLFWCATDFIELRNLVIARLTLFNGRRGGETARLTINDWLEAKEDGWIDKNHLSKLSESDKLLVQGVKLAYQTGKGNRSLVSLIIPNDTAAAMEKLSDSPMRKSVGINPENHFVFASTQLSEYCSSGWHALKLICSKIDLEKPHLVNATGNRHLVATEYAALNVDPLQRRLFYAHMGHSEEMNRMVYQAPLGLQQVTHVGKNLLKIGQGPVATDSTLSKDAIPSTLKQTSVSINGPVIRESTLSKDVIPSTSKQTSVSIDTPQSGKKRKQKRVFLMESESEFEMSESDDDNVLCSKRKKYHTRGSKGNQASLGDKGCKDNNSCFQAQVPVQREEQRSNASWLGERHRLFIERFGGYVRKTESKPMPDKEDVLAFLQSIGNPFGPSVVRTKINNERKKHEVLVMKRRKDLGMDVD